MNESTSHIRIVWSESDSFSREFKNRYNLQSLNRRWARRRAGNEITVRRKSTKLTLHAPFLLFFRPPLFLFVATDNQRRRLFRYITLTYIPLSKIYATSYCTVLSTQKEFYSKTYYKICNQEIYRYFVLILLFTCHLYILETEIYY